jgi:hypothetical protein
VIASGGAGGRGRRLVAAHVAQLGGVAAAQAPSAVPLVLTAEGVTLGTMVTRRVPVAHPRNLGSAEQ